MAESSPQCPIVRSTLATKGEKISFIENLKIFVNFRRVQKSKTPVGIHMQNVTSFYLAILGLCKDCFPNLHRFEEERNTPIGVMDDVGHGFQVNIHGVLSSNAFFNFVNHYKTQNNLEGEPMSELTKEAAVLWSAMSNEEKMPFKRSASAVKKFKAKKRKKAIPPYKVIGYQSDLTLGKNNELKMKEMIAYSHSLKLNLKRLPTVEFSSDSESE